MQLLQDWFVERSQNEKVHTVKESFFIVKHCKYQSLALIDLLVEAVFLFAVSNDTYTGIFIMLLVSCQNNPA